MNYVLLEIQFPQTFRFTPEGEQLESAAKRVKEFASLALVPSAGSLKALNDTMFLCDLEKGLPFFSGLVALLMDTGLDYRVAQLGELNWIDYKSQGISEQLWFRDLFDKS